MLEKEHKTFKNKHKTRENKHKTRENKHKTRENKHKTRENKHKTRETNTQPRKNVTEVKREIEDLVGLMERNNQNRAFNVSRYITKLNNILKLLKTDPKEKPIVPRFFPSKNPEVSRKILKNRNFTDFVDVPKPEEPPCTKS